MIPFLFPFATVIHITTEEPHCSTCQASCLFMLKLLSRSNQEFCTRQYGRSPLNIMTIHLLAVYMCVPPSVVIILMSHFMFIVREEQVRVDLAH